MPRMTAGQLALAIEKIRAQDPQIAHDLEAHLESVNARLDAAESDDSFTILVREVAEGLAVTRTFLELHKPLHERGVAAMERIATEEKRHNDLDERKLTLEEARLAADMARDERRFNKLVVPIVTAVLSLLTGAGAAWMAATFDSDPPVAPVPMVAPVDP